MSLPKTELLDHALHLYRQAPPVRLKRIPFLKKWLNERKLKKLVGRLRAGLADDEINAKEFVTGLLMEIDEQQLLFDRPFLRFFLEKGYLEAAETFIDQTREKDGQLETWEVYQAMRNVWIMNSLQIHWDLPLEVTPSVYAYSLLYPYTDNYLDDPSVSVEDKKAFNDRLSRVIKGEKDQSHRIFELIGSIEQQFPREAFPDVFESLQFIHDAQIDSLIQHASLSTDNIRHVTFEKGGSSVLADAFLVKGALTKTDMQFAFNYGAFLQMVDDLQDIEEDKKENRLTLFTLTDGYLDQEIRRLLAFIYASNPPEDKLFMQDVIRSCTVLMVMEAASRQLDRLSPDFQKELEAASPVRLSFYPHMTAYLKELLDGVPLNQPIRSFPVSQ